MNCIYYLKLPCWFLVSLSWLESQIFLLSKQQTIKTNKAIKIYFCSFFYFRLLFWLGFNLWNLKLFDLACLLLVNKLKSIQRNVSLLVHSFHHLPSYQPIAFSCNHERQPSVQHLQKPRLRQWTYYFLSDVLWVHLRRPGASSFRFFQI